MNIRFTKRFIREARQLRKTERLKLESKLKVFSQNPYDTQLRNHSLKGNWAQYRSIDVTGDIRALYLEKGEEAIFDAVGTHSQLYG